MNKTKKLICSAVILTLFITLYPHIVCAEPNISAQSAILIESTSGRILYSKNSDQKLPMASTTKIMTAICALEYFKGNPDEQAEISQTAANVEGSSMYLQAGEQMSLKELLYGLMLSSGNDAAVAISERVCENQEAFVSLMNEKAKQIGLFNTNFKNPNGLPDEEHYSTASDMAKLCAYALKNPTFSEIVKTKNYKISGDKKAYPRILTNHNKLLSMYEGCVGVKTGFTKAAGRCLVSSAICDDMQLVCVTLNAPNDWNDHISLFNFGFENYRLERIFDTENCICTKDVEDGEGLAQLYPESSVMYPLKNGEKVSYDYTVNSNIQAPVKSNDRLGEIKAILNDREISKTPIVSHSNVNKISFFKLIGNQVKLFFGTWVKIEF